MQLNRIGVGQGQYRGFLRISGWPEATQVAFRRQTSVPNPAYRTALRFSRTGRVLVPRHLHFSAPTTDGALLATRGAWSFLTSPQEFKVRWQDCRTSLPVKFPPLRVTLNKEQQAAVEVCQEALEQNTRPAGNFLLLASTAVGKTIMQAAIAALLGQRTLVLFPTELIKQAWWADLHKAFGLGKDQLGLIQQNCVRIGKYFTLASVATIGRREHLWNAWLGKFGTIVVDEAHTVGGDSPEETQLYCFLRAATTRFLVGATATAQGLKGRNWHLQSLFGEPLINLNTYATETSTSTRIGKVHLVRTAFRFQGPTDLINWHELGPALYTNEERNQLVVRNVLADWNRGRMVLVVTRYQEHAQLLLDLCREAGASNLNLLTGTTNTNRAYTRNLLKGVAQRKVGGLVATTQAIKLGANLPVLDSLHIAMPSANARDVEQLAGRIRRRAEGKPPPEITYYYDTQVAYLKGLYLRVYVPVFTHLQVPGYESGMVEVF